MATIQFPRKGEGGLGAAPVASARVIDVVVDMANDVEVGATDDLVVVDLPKGTVVLAVGLEQVEAGEEATGTLTGRLGTTAVTEDLDHDDDTGTVVGMLTGTDSDDGSGQDQVLPVVLDDDETLNVLSATAARETGKVRVFAVVLEGTKIPPYARAAVRDTSI